MSYRALPNGSFIQAEGSVDRRLRKALYRLTTGPEYTKEFILSDVTGDFWRVFTEYCGDISGRYVGAVALGRTYTGDSWPMVDEVAAGIAAAQREDGHFNLDPPPGGIHYQLIYGHGRLLQGLVEYYSVRPAESVLRAIRRLADYFADTAADWRAEEVVRNEEFIYYTQSLEGVVGAYQATRDPRHLELARSMASLIWEEPKHHSHSYISSLLGVLGLYEAIGEEPYLRFVEEKRDQIAGMVAVDGGVTEMLPDKWVTEYCSVADWLMLHLRLGAATGQARYYEEAERILTNAVFWNQFANGGFGTWRVDKQNGYPGRVEVGSAEAYWCCSFHGARSLYDTLCHAYTVGEDGVSVNLFLSSRLRPPRMDGVVIRQETEYPVEGRVRFLVSARGREFALRIRRPLWARDVEVRLNGEAIPGESREGYLHIRRTWGAEDAVELRFETGLRLEGPEGPIPPERLIAGATLEGVTLRWGPVLLAIDEMLNAAGPSDDKNPWTAPHRLLLPPSEDGFCPLPRADSTPAVSEWPELAFAVPAVEDFTDLSQPRQVTLTPLARQVEMQPACSPSSRTRYDARICERADWESLRDRMTAR